MSYDHLFVDGYLSDYLRQRTLHMKSEIDRLPESEILVRDEESWAEDLAARYTVQIPDLKIEDQFFGESEETQVDVSGDHNRATFEPGPFYIPGRTVVYHLPFEGDADLFRLRGSSYTHSPPRARITGGELQLRISYPSDKKPDIKAEIDRVVGGIKQHLTGQAGEVREFNEQVRGNAIQMIQARKTRILADREFIGDLGIPIKTRGDAPTTYAAPGITRRPAPSTGKRSKKPSPMEPVLVNELYEHICQVVRAAGRAMERLPGSHADRDEETLRDFILTMLNTHYEGQATGETFQGEGKTDILVRAENQNLFVGECKWWSGAAAFSDAIDQLYSYITLRDTKLALVVFVKAKGFSEIVEKARAAVEAHESFESWKAADEDGELRARVALPSDQNRHATLHVFLFHISTD